MPPTRSSDELWRGPQRPVVAIQTMDTRKRETRP